MALQSRHEGIDPEDGPRFRGVLIRQVQSLRGSESLPEVDLNPVVLGATARHTNGRPLACTTPNMLFGTCATLSTRRLDSLLEQAGHVFGALCLATAGSAI